jgi:hypothetical protein
MQPPSQGVGVAPLHVEAQPYTPPSLSVQAMFGPQLAPQAPQLDD